MITLYDLITQKQQGEGSLALALPTPDAPLPAVNKSSISAALINLVPALEIMPQKDVSEFSQSVAKLVTDDQFLKELSDTIQQPSKGETEDEFVKRCNKALFALLDERLKSK
jgi:hypothetical protein